MEKIKICFIAQFPPPIHGLSKAVGTLYDSDLSERFTFEKINITDNKKIIQNLKKIERSRADLFYFTISQTKGGNLRDLMLLQAIDRKQKKCLIHLHGGHYRRLLEDDLGKWQKKENYRLLGKLDGAIVLGDSFRKIFEGILSEKKIFVVPNCVDDKYLINDIDFVKKISTLKQRTEKHVLYLSNLIRSKGYPKVLKMARAEAERIKRGGTKRFHFDFAGAFIEKKEEIFFFRYIKENQLWDHVTYHGVVSGEKKRALLKLCDLFVLLTRYPMEGQPISILEAMGNGMTIITTDHAGIPDIVKDGENGFIIEKEDQDLSRILISLSEDDMVRMAQKNREKVVEGFSQDRYLSDMEEVFLRVSSSERV